MRRYVKQVLPSTYLHNSRGTLTHKITSKYAKSVRIVCSTDFHESQGNIKPHIYTRRYVQIRGDYNTPTHLHGAQGTLTHKITSRYAKHVRIICSTDLHESLGNIKPHIHTRRHVQIRGEIYTISKHKPSQPHPYSHNHASPNTPI